MKKNKPFNILFHYLKNEKLKVFIYIILILFTYIPGLLTAYFWGLALDGLIKKDINIFILYLGIWEGIYIVFYTILQIPRDLIYNFLEIKFMKNVSIDLYKKIDSLPCRAFEDIGVGEYINRLYNDPDRIMDLLSQLIKLICKALVGVVVLVISFRISLLLGLEVVVFCLIMGLISYKFFPKIKKTQENIKKESDKYVKQATENITGIREIKSLGIKKNTEKNIFNIINNMFTHNRHMKKYEVYYYAIDNFVYFTLQFVILFTAGYYVYTGAISLALFMMLDNCIWRVDDVVESLSDFGINYNKVTVSLNRIGQILNNELYKDEHFGNITLTNTKGNIKFNHVYFKYRENEDYILNNLNLNIEPHKKIAIVGKSGNGKSTIFNLLTRYFDATSGSILIDDTNIEDLTEESLRNNISVIRQTPFLFNMSFKDNFKLVNKDVTLEEIRKYCKEAYIDDYIMSLKDKYDTIIGEGGVNLSGGQKQRLAIARTLMRNTKIILFDEATSALDNESQDYIKKTIDNLVKTHTVIVVAHRLSTIVDSDIIYVIDKGRLEAKGTHKELLKDSTIYKNLYNNEFTINN